MTDISLTADDVMQRLDALVVYPNPNSKQLAREAIERLVRERDEARTHVLRVESQRMGQQLIHDRLDVLVAELRRLGHPVTAELTDAPAAAATTGGEASCDVCERPHPTVEYCPGANGHICRPCANVTVTGGEAQA